MSEMKKNESFSVDNVNQLRVISPKEKNDCLEPDGLNASLVTTLDPGCEDQPNISKIVYLYLSHVSATAPM